MADRIAMLFPGQGSQTPGMGIPYKNTPEFSIARDAGEVLSLDVEKLLLDESPDALSSTHDAQLSVLLTSLMAYETLKAKGDEPICFAGHSLGQVTALICAGAISLEEGIRFASVRAKATQKCADAREGKMAALLGADNYSANALCDSFPEIWIANDNAPGQIVVAGNPDQIEKAAEIARDYEIKKVVVLPVNGAFHTPYMEDAVDELKAELATMTFNDPIAGVASNDDGRAYTKGNDWEEKLSVHVARPVKWRDCMDAVALLEPDMTYEVGNGTTLTGLAKRCTPELLVRPWPQTAEA